MPESVADVDLAIITVRSRMQSSSCCPDFNNFTEEGLARQLGVKAGLFQLVSSCITGIPLRSQKMQSQMFSQDQTFALQIWFFHIFPNSQTCPPS